MPSCPSTCPVAEGEMQAQKNVLTCAASHSWEVAEPDLWAPEPALLAPHLHSAIVGKEENTLLYWSHDVIDHEKPKY